MADWKGNAIDDLKRYACDLISMEILPEKIRLLEDQMQFVKGTQYDKTPVEGGSSGYEERLINYLDSKTRLERNLKAAQERVDIIEHGLSVLSDTERLVLQRFYINREKNSVERLKNELGYEKSEIYRIKDNALKRFTVAMCGAFYP